MLAYGARIRETYRYVFVLRIASRESSLAREKKDSKEGKKEEKKVSDV